MPVIFILAVKFIICSGSDENCSHPIRNCKESYTDNLCASCSPGYGRSGLYYCKECKKHNIWYFVKLFLKFALNIFIISYFLWFIYIYNLILILKALKYKREWKRLCEKLSKAELNENTIQLFTFNFYFKNSRTLLANICYSFIFTFIIF